MMLLEVNKDYKSFGQSMIEKCLMHTLSEHQKHMKSRLDTWCKKRSLLKRSSYQKDTLYSLRDSCSP